MKIRAKDRKIPRRKVAYPIVSTPTPTPTPTPTTPATIPQQSPQSGPAPLPVSNPRSPATAPVNANGNGGAGAGAGGTGEKLLAIIPQYQANLARPTATPGEQVVALCNLISIVTNPKNQPFLLKQLEATTLQELQQTTLQAALTYHRQLPALMAQALGLSLTDYLDTAVVADTGGESEHGSRVAVANKKREAGEGEGEGEAETDPETEKPRRVTRAKVAEMVNTPIDPQTYYRLTGWKRTKPVYISSNERIPKLTQLLAEYGALSVYQLTALLSNQDAAQTAGLKPRSILKLVRQGLSLLAYKELVITYPVASPAHPRRAVKLWQLSRAGELYYTMLTDGATALSADSPDAELQTKHNFGTNEVVTALVAASATASRLGVIEQIARQVLKAQPSLNMIEDTTANSGPGKGKSEGKSEGPGEKELELPEIPALVLGQINQLVRTPKPKVKALPDFALGCHLEMTGQTSLVIGNHSSRNAIRPDAMGRIVYDTELVLPTILKAASIEADSEEAEFTSSTSTGRHYWPFVLEYDRATETSEFFATTKAEGYTQLYNTIKTGWPLEWGSKFPVILVVSEGSPSYLLSLITAIRTQLIRLRERSPQHRQHRQWWFTCSEWFNQLFQPYLDAGYLTDWYNEIYPALTSASVRTSPGHKSESQSQSEGEGEGGSSLIKAKAKAKGRLNLAPDPRIWLPLDTKMERAELTELSRYLKKTGSSPKNGLSLTALPPPLPKALQTNRLRALPLPLLFNVSSGGMAAAK